MTRSVERRAQGVHSAYLLHMNQRASAHVVVKGGDETDRVEAVRALHETGPLCQAPFCAVHGARDEYLLVRSLNHWLGHEDGPSPLECSGGTLYVDEPGTLSLLVQRLLIDHSERLEERKVVGLPIIGPVRLAVGAARDLQRDVESGRLLPALHDTLDKFRIRLGGRRRVHAR